ncbi:response regulator transcription factor [Ruminococcus sp.]|uniref:response regulator transcription factor n=1 Tax=Ruminococcus sp. TaxID=41978 RepID=UPI0038707906
MMRILFAEDDRDISKAVKTLLTRSGYSVDTVYNGRDAIDYIEQGGYDGVILDWMMPGLSGIEVLAQMRSNGITTPVLMLTARDAIEDRVEGLDTGADDYLPKPFAASELLARIRAMLRRKEDYKHDVIKFADIELDKSAMAIRCHNKSVSLTNKAFQLMEMLVEHPGAVLSISQIMERVWGWDSDAEVNVVWVNISFLRKKLSELGAHVKIKAVRGVGYSLESTL